MTSCGFPQELLSAFLDGEVTPEEAHAATEHLRGCASCRETLSRWKQIGEKIPQLVPAEGARLASGMRNKLRVRRRRAIALVAAMLTVATMGGAIQIGLIRGGPPEPAETPNSFAGPRSFESSPRATPRATARPSPTPTPSPSPTPSYTPKPYPGIYPCSDTGEPKGATDVGVTATSVNLATTVAESGIGAASVGEGRAGMEAIRNKINRAGGICGRMLKIDYIDDGWDAQRGALFLRNAATHTFAIPVAPSSEGLRVFIASGEADRIGIPIVGTLGILPDEFTDPWVWPGAAGTDVVARAMAVTAFKSGARTFGVVFDKNYRFGHGAAKTFNSEVKRLTGHAITGYNVDNECQKSYCGILAGQSSYSNEVREYYINGGKVDFTALFLEPQTALVWMGDPNATSAKTVNYGGAPPLFTRNFATNCQGKCGQMQMWTPFKPYIESNKSDRAVQLYVADLRRQEPQADIYNWATEGSYSGMMLLAKAIARTGTNLTRERLRDVLNSQRFNTGLTWDPIRYDAAHNGTACVRAFRNQYTGTFAGWRSEDLFCDTHTRGHPTG